MTTNQTTNPRLLLPFQPDLEDCTAHGEPALSNQLPSIGQRLTRLARLAANEHARQLDQRELDLCEGSRQ